MSKYSNSGICCRPLALVTAISAGLSAGGLQAATIEVTSTNDAPVNTVTQDCLLRDALVTAAGNGDQGGCTISGDPDSDNLQIDLSELSGDLQLEHGQIEYQGQDRSISLLGPGKDTLVLRADAESRIIDFDGADNDFRLVVQGLGFQDGDVDGDGGAVNFQGRELTLVDVAFSNNQASGNGGGLHAYLQVDEFDALPEHQILGISIEDSLISGNHAEGTGGGIYADLYAYESSGMDLRFNLTDSVIENNSIDGHRGGGIGALMEGKYGSEDSIEALIEGNHFENNQVAGGSGGGLGLWITSDEADVEEVNVDILDNHFQNNEASARGGGLQISLDWADGRSETSRSEAQILFEDNHFESNRSNFHGGAARIGAFITNERSPEIQIQSRENTFLDNQSRIGGALSIEAGMQDNRISFHPGEAVEITSMNDHFAGNTADFPGGDASMGGALATSMYNRVLNNDEAAGPTRLFIENTTFIDHSSNEIAGAIWAETEQKFGSELMIQGSTLTDNHAQGDGGAGFVVGFEQVTMLNATISGNQTSGSGGGLLITESEEVDVRHATIADNEAGQNGGGLHVSGAETLAIDHVILGGNLASNGAPELDNSEAVTADVRYSLIEAPEGADIDDLEGNLFEQAHELKPLADNGGLTPTRDLRPSSPVINSGDADLESGSPEYDQRGPGFPRKVGPSPDIGAIEYLGLFSDRFEDSDD